MICHILKFLFLIYLQIVEEEDDEADTTQPAFYVRHDTHGIIMCLASVDALE